MTSTITPEDTVVAKLKGHNCLIKFKDGEELYVFIPDLAKKDDASEWLMDVEKFINGDKDVEYFPAKGLSISRDSVKYIMKI